jgi:hypothetical protein
MTRLNVRLPAMMVLMAVIHSAHAQQPPNALYGNTTGKGNAAQGVDALYSNTTGIRNLGSNGSNNIEIGTAGVSTDNNTIQNGVQGTQTQTDIASMGSNTEKLQQLRPVSFHLKSDPQGPVQYGLIAEEVDQVYPELVIRDGKGQVQGVRYEELAPMLLGEVQQQRRTIDAQAAKIHSLEQQVAKVNALERKLDQLHAELGKIAVSLSQDERIARR